jgi:hypothetical protein
VSTCLSQKFTRFFLYKIYLKEDEWLRKRYGWLSKGDGWLMTM